MMQVETQVPNRKPSTCCRGTLACPGGGQRLHTAHCFHSVPNPVVVPTAHHGAHCSRPAIAPALARFEAAHFLVPELAAASLPGRNIYGVQAGGSLEPPGPLSMHRVYGVF